MWLFTRIGFFSVVKDKRNENHVQVRTRSRKDAKAFSRSCFSSAAKRKGKGKILHTPDADYPFRVIVRDMEFLGWLTTVGNAIDYTNFKAAVPERAHVYHDVWNVMARAFMHDREE